MSFTEFPPHRHGRYGGRKKRRQPLFSARAQRRQPEAPDAGDWRDRTIFDELDRLIASGQTRSGMPEQPDEPDELIEELERAKGAGA